jgi:hypothetical protein
MWECTAQRELDQDELVLICIEPELTHYEEDQRAS